MTVAELKRFEKVEEDLHAEPCSLCGSSMKEVLRVEEARSVFVWLECTKANCPGRWLKQYSLA